MTNIKNKRTRALPHGRGYYPVALVTQMPIIVPRARRHW